jgi:carboxymethylenebutenolidase
MTEDLKRAAITLYDRFTHGQLKRRDFMAKMAALTGSIAAANALIGTIAARADAAPLVAVDDPRLKVATIDLALPGLPSYRAYSAAPKQGNVAGHVIVIHENRGLNDHIRDVARRLAVAGFAALAPDFLSPAGGTPTDKDKARDMIGKLDLAQSTAHALAHLRALKAKTGKVGAVGFCWGGAFVDRLAVAAGWDLAAGVSYYGPAPDPADAAKVGAPLLFHLAGLDDRVAGTAWPFIAALGKAGKALSANVYPGVDHAFNNDTSAERYNKVAAELAWDRTLQWFSRYLG